MPIHNGEIKAVPNMVADLLEIQRENPFRVRAYRNAAGTVANLMKIPGLGTKRVAALDHELNVTTLDDLAQAAKEGRIHTLEGFGSRTEQHILEEVTRLQRETGQRIRLVVAEQIAEPLMCYLKRKTRSIRGA